MHAKDSAVLATIISVKNLKFNRRDKHLPKSPLDSIKYAGYTCMSLQMPSYPY